MFMGNGKYFQHMKKLRDEVVTLERNPEILQSIGPGGKLFSAKFVSLRFDEDVVFCEEHTFMVRAFLKHEILILCQSSHMAIMSEKDR